MQSRLQQATGRLRAVLNESLFAPASPPAIRFSRAESAVLVVAFLVLAITLQLFRIGPETALDSLWAEDGQIFLQGAINDGLLSSLVDPYAGYLVLVPRLIGDLGALVPLESAPAAIAIAASFVVALCGLAVWHASAALIRNPLLRGTLVVLTVLAPVASLESVASGSYVLWYMLFASFWLLLWRPRTALGAGLGAALLLATGLSTPAVWFFAPLAALRAVAIRDRLDAIVVGGWALGAVVQLPVVALNDEPQVEPLWTGDIWTAFLQRVLDGAALGEGLGGEAWEQFGWPLPIVILALSCVGLAACLWRSESSARIFVPIAVLTAVAMWVISAYERAVAPHMVWPEGFHFGNGGRYALVPALLLVSALLVAVDRLPRWRRDPRWASWAGIGLAALLLVGAATSFDVGNVEGRGEPPWGESVDAAADSCARDGLSEVPIPTSPPGFGVVLPCADLPAASEGSAAR